MPDIGIQSPWFRKAMNIVLQEAGAEAAKEMAKIIISEFPYWTEFVASRFAEGVQELRDQEEPHLGQEHQPDVSEVFYTFNQPYKQDITPGEKMFWGGNIIWWTWEQLIGASEMLGGREGEP